MSNPRSHQLKHPESRAAPGNEGKKGVMTNIKVSKGVRKVNDPLLLPCQRTSDCPLSYSIRVYNMLIRTETHAFASLCPNTCHWHMGRSAHCYLTFWKVPSAIDLFQMGPSYNAYRPAKLTEFTPRCCVDCRP